LCQGLQKILSWNILEHYEKSHFLAAKAKGEKFFLAQG